MNLKSEIKKGVRVRYSYLQSQRYQHWRVSGVGYVVDIDNRRDLPIAIQPRNSKSLVLIKRSEIIKILKDTKLKHREHPSFARCKNQLCCY